MNTKELILMCEESLSLEEIPDLNNLIDMEEMISQIDVEPLVLDDLQKGINKLKKDSIKHSQNLLDCIKIASGVGDVA